eukprot:3420343-Amphidinium_carterae.2
MTFSPNQATHSGAKDLLQQGTPLFRVDPHGKVSSLVYNVHLNDHVALHNQPARRFILPVYMNDAAARPNDTPKVACVFSLAGDNLWVYATTRAGRTLRSEALLLHS